MSILVLPRVFELDLAAWPASARTAASPSATPLLNIVSLRWRVAPDLGFPRTRFRVFSRTKAAPPFTPFASLTGPITVKAQQDLEWGRIPQIDLSFQITPQGLAVTCYSLDDLGEPLPNESVTIPAGTAPVRVWFHAPNICALRVMGPCAIAAVTGFSLLALARKDGWTRCAWSPEVPLAFDALSADAKSLSLDRLQKAQANTPGAPPPPVGLTWRDLNPSLFLTALEDPSDNAILSPPKGIIGRLSQMMAATIPPAAPQSEYKFSEPDVDGPVEWPVGPVMLMSASMDNWLALALGLGSTEVEPQARPIPGYITPVRAAELALDYMVTADFDSVTRSILGLQTPLQLAAIANPPSFPVRQPESLSAASADFPAGTARRLRPTEQDDLYLDEVQLKWKRDQSGAPYAFAVAAVYPGRQLALLNPERANSYTPFLPVSRTQSDMEDSQFLTHIDRKCPVPLTKAASPATTTYYCAHVDVFGRWSAWSQAAYTNKATDPHTPGVLRVTPAADLKSAEVEWNCLRTSQAKPDDSDRRLNQIEFRAGFFKPGSKPDPNQPLFALDTQLPFKNLLDPPQTAAALASPLPTDPNDIPPPPPRYSTTIQLTSIDFKQGTNNQLDLVVFARAAEGVDPSNWSLFSAPAVAGLADPTPPSAPSIGALLRWTSVPDARNVARALLAFPAVPDATGYAVYRCSETAIRSAAGLPVPGGRSAQLRRNEMAPVVLRPEIQDLFLRINTTLFPDPHIEVEISGDSRVLYAYYVTAISQNNVESAKSAVTFVGVPQRRTPSTPELQAIPGSPNTLRVPVGDNFSSVSLYRCRSKDLAKDVALMGPPIATQTPPVTIIGDQTGFDAAIPPMGEAQVGTPPIAAPVPTPLLITIDFKDSPSPRWRPYYYRAVAQSAPAVGWLSASSAPSRTAEVFVLPTQPPDLLLEATGKPPHFPGVVAQIHSSADVRSSPLGEHRLEFFALSSPVVPIGKKPDKSTFLTALALENSPRDANGRWSYSLSLPPCTNVVVRLTDPAGRVTESGAIVRAFGGGPIPL